MGVGDSRSLSVCDIFNVLVVVSSDEPSSNFTTSIVLYHLAMMKVRLRDGKRSLEEAALGDRAVALVPQISMLLEALMML